MMYAKYEKRETNRLRIFLYVAPNSLYFSLNNTVVSPVQTGAFYFRSVLYFSFVVLQLDQIANIQPIS